MSYETTLQHYPVCPHCGYAHPDAWEWNFGAGLDGDGEHDCDECGEPFGVERVVTVDYTTRKIKPPPDAAVAILSERPAPPIATTTHAGDFGPSDMGALQPGATQQGELR